MNRSSMGLSALAAGVILASCASDDGLVNLQNSPNTLSLRDLSSFDTVIYMLDVGGSAIVVDHGDTEVIIDGGYRHARAGHDRLLRFLEQSGVVAPPIELMVVTHGDGDHYKGLSALFGTPDNRGCLNPPPAIGRIQTVWESGYTPPRRFGVLPSGYEGFRRMLVEAGGDHCANRSTIISSSRPYPDRPVSTGSRSFVANGLTVELLHENPTPDTDRMWHPFRDLIGLSGRQGFRTNNSSLVVRIDSNGSSALLTADINGLPGDEATTGTPARDVEGALVSSYGRRAGGRLDVDVLLMPHHGAMGSGSQDLVCAASPDFVLFSHREFPFFGLRRLRALDTHPTRAALLRVAGYNCPSLPGVSVSPVNALRLGTRIAPVYCAWNAASSNSVECGYVAP